MDNHPAIELHCGRCGKTIPPGQEETCWYCIGPLCYDCWDQYGHCGHERADEINKQAAERHAREKGE